MGAPAQHLEKRQRSLQKRLTRALGQAIGSYDMIAEGDRIMCAVSGGKDSYVMHELLIDLQRRAPVRFELLAVNLDQGHPGYPREVLHDYMAARGDAFRMLREDTYSIVKAKIPEGKTTCSLCSRLRRGILYSAARELGCNKIALGHHRDDIVVTLMLNLMFSGQLKAMPPRLLNDAGDITVIRPLAFAAEDDIGAYAALRAYPIIPCTLCGSQANMQRRQISDMLAQLEQQQPNLRATMLAALRNVRPSHLLDTRLWEQLQGVAPTSESSKSAGAHADNADNDMTEPAFEDVVTQASELIQLRTPAQRDHGD